MYIKYAQYNMCIYKQLFAYISKESIMLNKFRAVFIAFVVPDIMCMLMLSDCERVQKSLRGCICNTPGAWSVF